MASFLPSRASPRPPHPKGRIPNLSSMDITFNSATSSISDALSRLSVENVQMIDEIIARSPLSATSFVQVFKAYGDVLQEHGMDSSTDVVYYKILLKLGVVRGADWRRKWETVKEQFGYGDGDETDSASTSTPRESTRVATLRGRGEIRVARPQTRNPLSAINRLAAPLRPTSSRYPLSRLEHGSITVHSHQDSASEMMDSESQVEAELRAETESETDVTESQETTDDMLSSSSPTTLIPRERVNHTKENVPSSYPPLPTIDQFLPAKVKHIKSIYHGASEFSSDIHTRASSHPQRPISVRQPLQPLGPKFMNRVPQMRPAKAAPKAPSRDTSVNEEDTWKKVRMVRDEKEADRFREVMLLEQCWRIWNSSLKWLGTMNEKVDQEHSKALLHTSLETWRLKLQTRQHEYAQIGQRHDVHLLKSSIMKWAQKAKAAQVIKWKDDMRKRMSLIKVKRDERILEDVWTKWRQVHQGEVAEIGYERNLVWRMLTLWRGELSKIEHMEVAADEFAQSLEEKQASRAWNLWKLQTDLREVERVARARTDTRVKEDILRTWKQRMCVHRKAEAFHDRHIVKQFYQAWKVALSKQHNLTHKAIKYKNRQDGLLLMAVLRMWTARERGQLMDRAKNSQTLQGVWMAWTARLTEVRTAEARAIDFRNRPSSALSNAALIRWRQAAHSRQNLLSQAVQYDQDVLMHRTLLVWRVQLRVKLKMAKHAKVARKYLLMKQAFDRWRVMVQDKKREERLKSLQLKIAQKYYEKWCSMATRQQYHQIALRQVESSISTRVLRNALGRWTNFVIALKLRELEIVDQRDGKTLSLCYGKWKAVSKQHADDLRLMQSYQYVKQEEIMRRMFSRWHSTAKTIRHRRMLLQEREEEMRLVLVEKAWDKWRERYNAERLRPLEDKFAVQIQKSRLYQNYLKWHSKTKSIPAIQFDSSKTKGKFWRVWREAMPKALQAREARKRDKEKLLARALDKWAQAYRTKIALKAVARARYLRLPSGAPRLSHPPSSVLRGVLHSSPSITSGKTTRPPSPSIDDRRSARAASVREDDSASRAGSSGTRRRPFALRAPKLLSARPTFGSGMPSKEDHTVTDLWRDLRRAQRKPASERM